MMNRRFLIFGVLALAIVAIVTLGFWSGGGWNDHEQITRVVPGQNGETLIIQEGGRRGFFPFFPFFLIFPLFWIFVIGGIFSLFGRRRWGGGPPFGPDPQERDAWLDDWHRRQHQSPPAAPGPPAGPAPPPTTPPS
ncbi:MAG: hypothetical protein M9947_00100 [Thermomicrobiales bacterium]|nr:hypothetical protein [Thermomicrobiales bacterium]